ncbi:DNA helicase [Caldibacillus lycopersici]|uniref:DNA 5'-3' helicase n=1 Tax=Perspicuibacillus lycopersici TaxID=1325689 RepID=A0AAE3LSU5_9BACI|nr:DnaB-like helicase C-terminal domain-containing protein [Perspicuibacillus lycopersici]MCU9613138.1 DNA helicase [Perspicuibacillus lycopersici]
MSLVEKAFLGSLMKENYLMKDTIITPNQLVEVRHQQLMMQMLELHQSGKGVDLITLSTLPNLAYFGGISYLNELLAHADIDKFGEIEDLILEEWKEREKRNILTIAAKDNWEISKVITHLDKINHVKMNDHSSITEALHRMYEAPWIEKEEEKIATSGLRELDKITGGFQNGELTILAARPSMGKTDVMLHFAKEVGWAGYLPIIFSLEMPEKLLTTRLIASTGKYNRIKLRNPQKLLSESHKARWASVIGKLNETYIQIFDQAGQTIAQMRAKIRKLMHQYPNRQPVIFIDYLTLIRPQQLHYVNSHHQVSEISQNLKTVAKDFECPVICLAQLNRSVEARANKRPVMSDIRESGSVEQDADVIIFLYREKYYDKASKDSSIEFIVAKNRNGPTGKIDVEYNEYTGRIWEETTGK